MQDKDIDPVGNRVVAQYELKEITELLVKHHGLHEGLFDLAFEFQVAIGGVGSDPKSILPGAMIGIRRMGLTTAIKEGIATVDAAVVNPFKKNQAAAKKPPKK